MTSFDLARLRTLPRAEVHVHLEGCFEAPLLEQWARRHAEPLPRPVERLFEFEGLADFLEFLDWACGLVRTRDELAEAAYAFSRRMRSSGAG
jgi:adenosine deaminase